MLSRLPSRLDPVPAGLVVTRLASDIGPNMKLSDLSPGGSAVLRELPVSGGTFLRLREMGLLPGTRVKLVRTAPLGDPLEIEVRGYHLSLRREEADLVLVDAVE